VNGLKERTDLGWTHIALPAHDVKTSITFYSGYAGLRVVHDRVDEQDATGRVVWLTDGMRPFVLVLVQTSQPVEHPLGPFAHLGIALPSAAAVDELVRRAEAECCLRSNPFDYGPPLGYLCMVSDPDGHIVEFSYGQEVGLTVGRTDLSL
jgi:catechol 2,3-dioxygenase-like lactoylglutathione lyase family enzyme